MFRRVKYKTESDFEKLRKSAQVVAVTLAEVAKYIKPGVPLTYLDQIGEECIRDHKAIPSFKGYDGFPAALCLSVNDVVVHGIPKAGDYLQDGDIISVDCGAVLNGFHGDFACRRGVRGSQTPYGPHQRVSDGSHRCGSSR